MLDPALLRGQLDAVAERLAVRGYEEGSMVWLQSIYR